MRLVRSHVGQQVGDEGAGHDDGLSLVADDGVEIGCGLRGSCWKRHQGAVLKGALRHDQAHGPFFAIEAVECGGKHQITCRSGLRRPGCGSLYQSDQVEFERALGQSLGAVGIELIALEVQGQRGVETAVLVELA